MRLEYQDGLLRGNKAAGERDCKARWAIIREYVPARGMVLDIGSNLGYFGVRMVRCGCDVGVLSIESDDGIVAKQRRIVASHGIHRICIVHGVFSSRVSAAWVQTCDWFELTLLLSVLHWFDDPAQVLRDVSQMSACLIAEVPDPSDAGACGQEKLKEWKEPVEWFRSVTGRRCSLVGRVKRHTSEVPSHVILVEGPVARVPRIPYWDSQYTHPEGNDYRLDYDGKQLRLTIRDQIVDYTPGVNLVTMLKLGRLVWPKPEYWIRSGLQRIRAWKEHLDPLPHNMLWTPGGLTLIDGDDRRGDARGRAAAGILKRTIRAWAKNNTAGVDSYVPHVAKWRRLLRHGAWRLGRRVLPGKLVEKIKKSPLYKRWYP